MGKKLAELKPSHQKFVKSIVKGVSKGQAGLDAGCTKKSASPTASKWLKNPKILSAIDELKKETAEKAVEESGINAVKLIAMFQNIHDIGIGEQTVKKKIVKEELGLSVEVESTEINLPAARAALESIGKHIGFFEVDNEQSRPTGILANNVTFTDAKG